MSTTYTVTCAQSAPSVLTGLAEDVPVGATATQVGESYWHNGEGWVRLRTADGRVFTSPDVFWSGVDGDTLDDYDD